MGHVTVFSGPEQHRRWSDDERLRILSEAFSPGACVARIAQQHDVSTSLVYTWRRMLRAVTHRIITRDYHSSSVLQPNQSAETQRCASRTQDGGGTALTPQSLHHPSFHQARL